MLWLPFYLQDSLGLEPASAAYVSTMFDIGGGIGSPLCGIVADKLCRMWPLCCCAARGWCCLFYPSDPSDRFQPVAAAW